MSTIFWCLKTLSVSVADGPYGCASGFTGLGSTTFLGLSAPKARQPLLLARDSSRDI